MRHFIIGDIHGCYSELRELLIKAGITPEDHVISVGDIIHKGPLEEDTLAYLLRRRNTTVLMGNHEEKHLRWYKHQARLKRYGIPNPMKHVEDYRKTDMTYGHFRQLHKSPIMYQGDGWIVVHGGIPSKLEQIHQGSIGEIRSLAPADRKSLLDCLRIRFETPDGEPVKIGKEKPEDIYWADVYDGRFGHCYFGHQTFPISQMYRQFEYATPLDYGCVHGGALVGVLIENDGSEHYYHVKAHREYAPYVERVIQNP